VIVKDRCRAEALVSTKPLSFLGEVDPTNGLIVEKTMICLSNSCLISLNHSSHLGYLEHNPSLFCAVSLKDKGYNILKG
jgi:hypothetical protein